jgi:thiol:disulfide interchange protein DsbA
MALLFLMVVGAGKVYAAPTLGRDYQKVNLPDSLKPKADVVEFFWYGSQSSYRFYPKGKALAQQNLKLDWRYLPAVMRSNWRPQAKAFYLAKESAQFNTLHEQLYATLAEDPAALQEQEAVAVWFLNRGEAVDELRKRYLSSSMNEQLVSDSRLVEALNLPGVPALLINGRYLVHAGMHNSLDSFQETAAYLLTHSVKK